MPHGLCGSCFNASVKGDPHARCSGDDCRCAECALATAGVGDPKLGRARSSLMVPNLQNIPIRTELGRAMRQCFFAPPRTVETARTPACIDWQRVARAIAHYTAIGYQYVEAPWIVGEEALAATLPPGRTGLRTQDGPLVGSAEQSFLQLMLDGQLCAGRYVAASPCFRDDEIDELHQRTFFKVELIWVLAAGQSAVLVDQTVRDATDFFCQIAPAGSLAQLKVDAGVDIELGGVEIGSYGCRQYRGHRWVYGTGLAEPRFSVARKLFLQRALLGGA